MTLNRMFWAGSDINLVWPDSKWVSRSYSSVRFVYRLILCSDWSMRPLPLIHYHIPVPLMLSRVRLYLFMPIVSSRPQVPRSTKIPRGFSFLTTVLFSSTADAHCHRPSPSRSSMIAGFGTTESSLPRDLAQEDSVIVMSVLGG